MIKIANHPYLAELETTLDWDDSGKFVALGELFETLGFSGENVNNQNKVFLFIFRQLFLLRKRQQLI